MIFLSIFLATSLVVSLYYNWRFANLILKIEDSIEDTLDILDKRYEMMSAILKKPVFFDSPEVRQVIKEISVSRDSILRIANILVEFSAKGDRIEEEDRNDS